MVKYRVRRNCWDVSGPSYRFSGPWRGTISVKEVFVAHVREKVGSGEAVFFWLDVWVGYRPLTEEFHTLFRCASNQLAKVKDYIERISGHTVWTPILKRHLREYVEIELLRLLGALNQVFFLEDRDDCKVWAPSKKGVFTVSSFVSVLSTAPTRNSHHDFQWKSKVLLECWLPLGWCFEVVSSLSITSVVTKR